MTQYKIAVITQDPQFASFFELEFSYRGFEVDSFSSLDNVGEENILSIIYVNTCAERQITNCRFVKVSPLLENVISHDSCSLTWPTSISDIDKLVRTIILGDIDNSYYKKIDSADTNILELIDKNKRTVYFNGRLIKLTKFEFDILNELCRRSGETVKRERIMELLGATQGNISDVYIYHLRKKLEENYGRKLIFTERGVGYRTILRLKR